MANGFGWNSSNVTVNFTCTDAGSGVASVTPATVLSSNGAGQSVTGTCTDNAGLQSSTTVSGINIDKTPPTIFGATTTSPIYNGWFNGDVSVAWTCSDALSGINGSCPAPYLVTGEGANLAATASVSDKANNAVVTFLTPIKIDRTPPNTAINAPGTWNNTDVNVILTPADPLSGVAFTYYTINSGSPQSGSSFTLSAEGTYDIEYWSVDNVGNIEVPHTAQVHIDLTDPTITHSQLPLPNLNNWNNTDVDVTFLCGDNLSGVASCGPDQTTSSEGAPVSVVGTAVDHAGNSVVDTAKMHIDLTPPIIDAAPDRAANANNWYNDDVLVSFTCDDTLSGIASCPISQSLGEGANQSAGGTATDAADNSAYDEVAGINIDKTQPSLTASVLTPESAPGWYNTPVDVQWLCSDALSGIDGACPANSTVSGEGMNLGTGASVADLAGNIANASVMGLNIDQTPPTLNYTLEAGGNPYFQGAWSKQDVTVTFACDDGLSGVAGFSVPQPVTTEGAGQSVAGTCTDNAGNVTNLSVDNINIDKTAPVIQYSSRTAPNGNGWNNAAVAVDWTCSDALSGAVSPTATVSISAEGANQMADGLCTDLAGNTAGDTQVGINIDTTAPSLSPSVSPNPVLRNSTATASPNASDALSGVDFEACGPVDTSNAGSYSVNCSALDLAGNSANASVSYDVATCSAGSYFNSQSASCLPADPGYYVPAADMDQQEACNAGFFSANSGSVSCTPAPLGYYVFEEAATAPTACPAGKYAPVIGMYSCINAQPGHFVANTGSSTQEMCPAGTFSATAGSSSCTDAPAGSFVDTDGATSAELCPLGTYSAVEGSIACTDAPAGSYVGSFGATEATACSVGTFSTNPGSASCDPAPAGYYINVTGAVAPIMCPAGSFSANPGSSSCTLAPAGSFVADPGSTEALLCPLGQFSAAAGALACTPAPAGSYVDTHGATAASECSVGYFTALPGTAFCDPAAPGQYIPTTGSTAPLTCLAGTFSAAFGSASCTPAPYGYFVALAGQSQASACLAGMYSPVTGAVSCLLADAGYFVGGIASIDQNACSPGYFSAMLGQISCDAATPGHFVASSASVQEFACAPGSYQPNSAQTSCLLADPGYFVPTAGEVAQTLCRGGLYLGSRRNRLPPDRQHAAHCQPNSISGGQWRRLEQYRCHRGLELDR